MGSDPKVFVYLNNIWTIDDMFMCVDLIRIVFDHKPNDILSAGGGDEWSSVVDFFFSFGHFLTF